MTSISTKVAPIYIGRQLIKMIEHRASIAQKTSLVQELKFLQQLDCKSLEYPWETILNVVIFMGDVELAKLLLQQGADPAIANNAYCANALDEALDKYLYSSWQLKTGEHFDLLELIIDSNPKCLESKMADYDKNYNTPLHQVAQLGSVSLFALFIAKGADAHCMNFYKQTPIDILLKQCRQSQPFLTQENILKEIAMAVKAYQQSKSTASMNTTIKSTIHLVM